MTGRTVLDEEQQIGFERDSPPFDHCYSSADDDKQPLIGAAMTVARAAFRLAGREDHARCLHSAVPQ
jgi:hypothetical protein